MIETPDPVESTFLWDIPRGFPRQGLGWRRRTATRKIFVTMRACMVKKPACPIFTYLNSINPPRNLWHGDHTNLLHDTTVTTRNALLSSRARNQLCSCEGSHHISDIRNTYRQYHRILQSPSTFYHPLELDNSFDSSIYILLQFYCYQDTSQFGS